MIGFKVPLKEAEKARAILLDEKIYDKRYSILKDTGHIILPVTKKNTSLLTKFPGSTYTDAKLCETPQEKNYKDYLKHVLSDSEIKLLPSSFDIVGDILIIQLAKELERHEKEIGKAILSANHSVKTVLKKTGIHEGEFRTQPLDYVAGEKRKETVYKENNVKIKLDVEKVYFSPRLSSERKRISEKIKKGESILVMFSGSGIYPIVISKNTKAKSIHGIEKNPVAHSYAKENLALNKIKNITLICGDVREEVPKLKTKFDRIIMPLPKEAEDFLDTAFLAAKKGTIIHLYGFEREEEITKGEEKVDLMCKKNNIKYRIKETLKCGQYSPGKFRICIDFEIL